MHFFPLKLSCWIRFTFSCYLLWTLLLLRMPYTSLAMQSVLSSLLLFPNMTHDRVQVSCHQVQCCEVFLSSLVLTFPNLCFPSTCSIPFYDLTPCISIPNCLKKSCNRLQMHYQNGNGNPVVTVAVTYNISLYLSIPF